MKMTSAASASAPRDARITELGGGRMDTPARPRKPMYAMGKAMKVNKKTTR